MNSTTKLLAGAVVALALTVTANAETYTLHGASQFDDSHPYTQAMEKFAELVAEKYQGPETVEFVLHKNSELGSEKDYFGYMNQGISVDYAIVSPSHMSTFTRAVTIMDTPFLFRDVDHYRKSIEGGVFKPIEAELANSADVHLLGYGGGEKRHFFGTKEVGSPEKLKDFRMRIQGSPIQTKIFNAIGAAPQVIAGGEVYNAIQTGVIEGAENSANAIKQLKWYEVGPKVTLSTVAITVRPLVFSGKRMRDLPEDLQAAIIEAGAEAMEFERGLEIGNDDKLMQQLIDEGKVTTYPFENREVIVEMAEPVKNAWAEEIGAVEILAAVNAIK